VEPAPRAGFAPFLLGRAGGATGRIALATQAAPKRRIGDLPPELRPRERLLAHGPDGLSTAELVAVLLGTGSRTRSALEVASDLIGRYHGLARLSDAGVRELCGVDGIGPVKALHLRAAFELGRRLRELPGRRRPAVSGPGDAARVVMDRLRFAEVERFLVLLLNTRHEVLDAVEVTRGGLASSPVHPREVFKAAVREGAAAVILVHNHPSGDPAPSRADLAVTTRLCRAAALMGIPVLDHVIIGDGRWVSLRERMPRWS
jgi:DNA repair protein RadC